MPAPTRLLRFHAAGAHALAALPPSAVDAVANVYPYETAGTGTADVTVRPAHDAWEVDAGALGRWLLEGTDAVRARLEWVLTETFLARLTGVVQIHACGVVREGAAALVLGPAEAGKSSVAMRWSVSGLPVLGDDIVLVDPDGAVRPFPRLFKVDPERLRDAGVDPSRTPFWTRDAGEAWFDPCGAGGWAEPAAARLVLIADRTGERAPGFRPLAPSEGLRALLAGRFPGGLGGAAAFEALARLVEGAECARLTFPGAAHACSAIRSRLA